MLSNKLFLILIFFILDFIHTASASINKSGPILRDKDNNVKDVEPIGIHGQPASSPPPPPNNGIFSMIYWAFSGGQNRVPVSNPNKISQLSQTKESITKHFKILINKKDYHNIIKLGDSMTKKDFCEYLCMVMTTLDHYKSLYECLTDRDMLSDFLAHGNQALVKEAIVKFHIYPSEYYIHREDISKAIIMCLNEDCHDRALSLLDDVRARYAEEDRILKKNGLDLKLRNFVFGFFLEYFRGNSGVSLKRLIAFKGEEFQGKYPEISRPFFMGLTMHLVYCIYDTDLRQFCYDFIGQPLSLMPTVPATGFLPGGMASFWQQPYIMCEWKEAITEGLNGKTRYTGQHLWDVIMIKYPGEFPAEYPPSDVTLTAVLKKFKSKQELEDDWTKKNIPILLEKLETIAFNLPTVLWNIIFGYATITWATTISWDTDNADEIIEPRDSTTLEQDPQQIQLIIHKKEQFKELIHQKKYDEIVKLGDSMKIREFLRYLFLSMTTLDHLKSLFKYLESHKMLLNFLVYGNAALVEEAIVEFGDPHSNFYINEKLVMRSITFFVNRNSCGHVVNTMKAMQARYIKRCSGMGEQSTKNLFNMFMFHWFKFYSPEEDSFIFKRFLTLHGYRFATKYPYIFGIFCGMLLLHLRGKLPYPKARTLLIDLVGQRSLLTSNIFVWGFSMIDDSMDFLDFFIHGWKEAIEEGLKQDYSGGGRQLWAAMVKHSPKKFTGAYPDTDELRAKACAGIKTKKEIEDEWFEKNMTKLLRYFEDIAAFLPKEVMDIIYGYLTFTWIIS